MRVPLLVAALPLVSAIPLCSPAQHADSVGPDRDMPSDVHLNGKDDEPKWQGLDKHPSWNGTHGTEDPGFPEDNSLPDNSPDDEESFDVNDGLPHNPYDDEESFDFDNGLPDNYDDEESFDFNNGLPDNYDDEESFDFNNGLLDNSDDEESFGPNDSILDDSHDNEESFDPNDSTLDDSHANEESFDPNDSTLDDSHDDEESFDPNDSVPGSDLNDDTQQEPSSTTTALDMPSLPSATQTQPAVSAPETPTHNPQVPPVSFITSTRAPTPSATEVPSGSDEPGYMATVNKWLSHLNIRTLKYDAHLARNALECSEQSGGALNHKMFPGSRGQVMAPGEKNEFERAFVAWLAERKDLFKNETEWKHFSQGWDFRGETGHADILANNATLQDGTPLYVDKIGCGWANRIWTCDLA